MDNKKQIKDKLHSFKEWCKDIVGLMKENRKITLAVLIFVALVVVAIVIGSVLGKKTDADGSMVAAALETESSLEEETLEVPTEPLEEDAYPEINGVVKKYYQAMDVFFLPSLYRSLRISTQFSISLSSSNGWLRTPIS